MNPPLVIIGGTSESFRGPLRAGLCVFAAPHAAGRRFSGRTTSLAPAPEVWEPAFASWLEALAHQLPGAVLVPASDNLAWWLALHQRELPEGLVAAVPRSFHAVATAQVKSRLAAAAAESGLHTPPTLVLESQSDLAAAADQIHFPMLLKPQMRTGMRHWTRGRVVRNSGELNRAWGAYLDEIQFEPLVLAIAPEARYPLAQPYVRNAGHTVTHLVGFRSRTGLFAAASHRKTLQVPRRFGNGVCFESIPVGHELAERLRLLLERIGYTGMFEAEFLPAATQPLLIDLNVRPYNGIALALRAGLDLVTLAYFEATGDTDRLARAVHAFQQRPFAPLAWCNHLQLGAFVAGQWLSGGLSRTEARSHLGWAWAHRGHMVDPLLSRADPWLSVRHTLDFAAFPFTRPREFLGSYFRRGLDR